MTCVHMYGELLSDRVHGCGELSVVGAHRCGELHYDRGPQVLGAAQ